MESKEYKPTEMVWSLQAAMQPFIKGEVRVKTEPVLRTSFCDGTGKYWYFYHKDRLTVEVSNEVGVFRADVSFTPAKSWADVLLDGLTVEQFVKTRIVLTPWSARRPATWRDFVNVEEARPLSR
jgi:hypothetical protein